jgi:prophage regulatory protein
VKNPALKYRTRIGRRREVTEVTGLGRSGIYRTLQTDPTFPRPVKLTETGRAVGWDMAAVERWVDARIKRGRIEWETHPARAAARRARAAGRKRK